MAKQKRLKMYVLLHMDYFKDDSLKGMTLYTHHHGYGEYISLERHPKCLGIR